MAELTPEANRAARAILKWSVRDLAEKAGIAFSTVHRFENSGLANEATKEKIKAAYAAHSVEITNGDGTGAKLLRPKASIPPRGPIDVPERKWVVLPFEYAGTTYNGMAHYDALDLLRGSEVASPISIMRTRPNSIMAFFKLRIDAGTLTEPGKVELDVGDVSDVPPID